MTEQPPAGGTDHGHIPVMVQQMIDLLEPALRAGAAPVLVDATLGAGVIEFGLRRAQNLSYQSFDVNRKVRAELKGQTPQIVWFTGLSGSGKSTVANLIEKRLTVRQMPEVIGKAMRITAVVMFIIAASSGFGWLVAQEQLAPRLAAWLSEGISERWMMLMLVNVFLFLISAVMDEIAVMVILGPLMIALAQKFGIDPIHFGSIIVTNVAIGMAAPPIGYCLFVGMAISGLSLGAVSRAIWPMVLAMLVVLMLTTYVPAFSLWLPGLVYRP